MRKIIAIAFLGLITLTAQAQQYSNQKFAKGDKAPDLVYQNPEGKELKLSQINKGRIVLLDFWASWCGPCRRANPKLVEFYNKYKDQKFKGAKNGFTVVSFSLDKSPEAWKKAIEADKLAWPYHMSDLKYWESEGGAKYGVAYVPQCFLIDADGKIIGNYMFAEEAEADLQKLLANPKKG